MTKRSKSEGKRWRLWFQPFTLVFVLPVLYLAVPMITGSNPLSVFLATDGVVFSIFLFLIVSGIIATLFWYLRIRS